MPLAHSCCCSIFIAIVEVPILLCRRNQRSQTKSVISFIYWCWFINKYTERQRPERVWCTEVHAGETVQAPISEYFNPLIFFDSWKFTTNYCLFRTRSPHTDSLYTDFCLIFSFFAWFCVCILNVSVVEDQHVSQCRVRKALFTELLQQISWCWVCAGVFNVEATCVVLCTLWS